MFYTAKYSAVKGITSYEIRGKITDYKENFVIIKKIQ